MLKNYIKAARLRTLPLSVSGIVVGSFLGSNTPLISSPIFWLAILTTIGFQVLSNFANDYGDGIKGTDNIRQGEERLVASGTVSPKQMKRAILITAMATTVIALLLIYISFGKDNFLYSVIFFLLGLAAILAAIKYTVGNYAYGYSGFGDVFVFVFFGLLAVTGTYFLYTKQLNITVFFPAFSVGLLSMAVLNLNNIRDKKNDKKAGKNTLVVKIGEEKAKIYHYCLIGLSFFFSTLYVIVLYEKVTQFLFMFAYIPLIKHINFVMKNKDEAKLDGELKKVALSTFVFSVLFGAGQVI